MSLKHQFQSNMFDFGLYISWQYFLIFVGRKYILNIACDQNKNPGRIEDT